MAEIELSILSRQCMDRRITDQETLKKKFLRGKKKEMLSPALWNGDLPLRMRG